MKTQLTQSQIESYKENGFVVIEDFLSTEELSYWRASVDNAIKNRDGLKIPGHSVKLGEADGINEDAEYFNKVFDQMINLWQTDADMKKIMLNEDLGKMAAELADVDGIRIWHDQALIKKPWANPTGWHLDTPFWSFHDNRALSVWVALDDATLENGCLFFIPKSYKATNFDNPGITKNMGAIFEMYPQFVKSKAVAATMKAGSASFHNGLTIHGAHANMTPGLRRAMTCAYMPDGATFNGQQNILTDEQVAKLQVGDVLNDDIQNPMIYSKKNSK